MNGVKNIKGQRNACSFSDAVLKDAVHGSWRQPSAPYASPIFASMELAFQKKARSLWCEVILPLAVPQNYTYALPAEFKDKVIRGGRVEVVFGRNKKYAALVKNIIATPPSFPTKDIIQIIDKEPVVEEYQLKLWEWMAAYYMCSEGEVMLAALPTHLKLSSESILIYNEAYGPDFSELDNQEYVIAEALLIKNQLHINEVQQIAGITYVYPVIKRLIEKQVCFIFESLKETYRDKKENFVLLHPDLQNEKALAVAIEQLDKAPKQLELLLSYLHFQKTDGEVIQSQLLKKSGASAAQLKALTDKNVFIIQKRRVDRIPALPKKAEITIAFNEAQEKAHTEIDACFDDNKPCLLHGVTGSGKTMLYIRQIANVLHEGKQVLYLLPEITLTSQIIRRLQDNFGGHVAVYHSKFNNNERMEIWNRIRSGEIKVVLGARSALFLPFNNLGLIIIDEEQDNSYKQQDPAPRYNARDAAIYYAHLFQAKVLLGSATPSVESYYNTRKGKYGLVTLNERYGGLQLPDIQIVDLKTVAASKKGKVMLSPQLVSEMEHTLKKAQQVILFQNRRGYAPLLICGTCGYIPKCTQCDVSLTLHKYSNKLHCHYCGMSWQRLPKCPACGSVSWRERNFGTEKVEEELVEQFPGYHTSRMDVDAVRGKNAHDTLIKLFEQKRIDILIGTQMVVKGLDFEHVALVGILDADGLLGFADFRVNERAFQMMEQVSGRAGRKNQQGVVLIQSLNTGHPVLQWVKNHDYPAFFDREIVSREQFLYPPFSRLIKITLKHKNQQTVQACAAKLAQQLQAIFPQIIGPAAPSVNRVRNQYLMEILLKMQGNSSHSGYKKSLTHQIVLLKNLPSFKSVQCVLDVDPF